MKTAGLLLALLSIMDAHAAELERIEVRVEDDVYHVHAQAKVHAGMRAVRAVITDYNHMHWITGAVEESRILERPAPDAAVIFVRSRACFGIFCKTIEQVQHVDAADESRIIFVTLPGEESDLRQGRAEWRLEEAGNGHTNLTWDMTMEPDFWVPWLIGPGLIRSGLADEGRDMINGIEKLANEREARR